ncbi:EthD family reductase [Actinocrinis sp.]|uniref:EthD family reductase n=1 Tax=Actinocrinis sp. TaxID=1920516 RepID=UPI002D4518A9|nr:EthD family reductase [Actinocrinis sp.]HZP49642.1 EthD family reductase [Actinocrinis sp.]
MVLFETPDDPEAFDRYYREHHIPLIKALPHLRSLKLSREVSPVRGEPYHFISTLEFDDMAALKDSFASPEGGAAARDVANLAGPDKIRSVIFETEDVDLTA